MFGIFKKKKQPPVLVAGIPTIKKAQTVFVTEKEFIAECKKVLGEYEYIVDVKKLANLIYKQSFKSEPKITTPQARDYGLNPRRSYNSDLVKCFDAKFFVETDPVDFCKNVYSGVDSYIFTMNGLKEYKTTKKDLGITRAIISCVFDKSYNFEINIDDYQKVISHPDYRKVMRSFWQRAIIEGING